MSPSTNHKPKVSGGFQWPFSLEVFYNTEEYRAAPPAVHKAVGKPEVDSSKRIRRRTFRWPFSLDAFYGTELYRVPVRLKNEITKVRPQETPARQALQQAYHSKTLSVDADMHT
jgi:hypothetical protein